LVVGAVTVGDVPVVDDVVLVERRIESGVGKRPFGDVAERRLRCGAGCVRGAVVLVVEDGVARCVDEEDAVLAGRDVLQIVEDARRPGEG
jgi:hypothetical protein